MNYEGKIEELTKRIEFLEKKERKRIIKARIALFFKLIILGMIIFALYKTYMFIKPYKEKIDAIDEKINTVTETINGIKKYNIFN